ncbi:MAG TPA: phosphate acetyltransferase [Sphaerochaeta sp.]|nr:phosphate acetyltransferase [Sphaerochaeta sp.]
MTFADSMKAKAKAAQKRLVLPEGTEERILKAARILVDQSLAKEVILIGSVAEVSAAAEQVAVSLDGITIVDPTESDRHQAYADEYFALRKHKGISESDAFEAIVDPLRWGAMMVRLSDADAMVAGAQATTAQVLVASFTIIKTRPGIRSASSCFVMATDKSEYGAGGSFIFSDCATIPNPTCEQLAEIALASADSCRTFLGVEPRVALLSYSTKGSAQGEMVDKVVDTLRIIKEKDPTLAVDGELQLDAAIVADVGASKAPGSAVAGTANTLIFPDLQSGNIGYKLVQRLAGAEAYGPILQGFAKPVSDLSRGCSIDDVVITSAITLAQSAT